MVVCVKESGDQSNTMSQEAYEKIERVVREFYNILKSYLI